jgi:hypothetical protein
VDNAAAATSARTDVDVVLQAVADGSSAKHRRLARWWPRSMWTVSRPGLVPSWAMARLKQA